MKQIKSKTCKIQKSINNRMSSFGLIEKDIELSHIFLAVLHETEKCIC